MYFQRVKKGIEIAVTDINSKGKEAIFFIHGWPLNSKIFEYQFNILPSYGYRCIALDLRGFGNSSKAYGEYSYEELADDIYTVIRCLDVNKLTLVGFSMGGALAIKYMSRYKGFKVSKLALLGAAAPSVTQYPGYNYGVTKKSYNTLIQNLYRDRPKVFHDFGNNVFASNVSDEFKDWFSSLGMEASSYAVIKTAELLRDENLYKDLSSIKVPTGIFHGVRDKICLFELALEMHKHIENSVLYQFEKSGHAIFYDQLEEFNNHFLDFLSK